MEKKESTASRSRLSKSAFDESGFLSLRLSVHFGSSDLG